MHGAGAPIQLDGSVTCCALMVFVSRLSAETTPSTSLTNLLARIE